ncbi:hypothetical protein ACFU7T_12100 [Streptomyces sp. NPDC057555]|uniref:hypothetical protein n=1 Tax=Streptomyces sp. NPDC057555 TaxID=3346166 RepID=UPI0036BFEF4E
MLFGEQDGLDFATWGTDSMYRHARHGADMRLTDDELLAVLLTAVRSRAWCVQVFHHLGPATWEATLWPAVPAWGGYAVKVDAGQVRTMLRTADHLMPPACEGAEVLRHLLSSDRAVASEAVEQLTPRMADRIMRYAAYGREVLS